jgi:hypothetical protein
MRARSNRSKTSPFDVQSQGSVVDFRQVVFLDSLLTSGYNIGSTDCVLTNLGVRASSLSKSWEYWRFNKLKVKAFLDVVAVSTEISGASPTQPGVSFAVGFAPYPAGDESSAPGSFADLSQMNAFEMKNSSQEISLVLPLKLLRSNPVKWFRANLTGSNTEDSSAGVFQYLLNTRTSLGNTYRMWITIEGSIELRGEISTSNSLEHPIDAPAATGVSVVDFVLTESKIDEDHITGKADRDFVVLGKPVMAPRLLRSESGVTAPRSVLIRHTNA